MKQLSRRAMRAAELESSREIRHKRFGTVECAKCGGKVAMTADTEEWYLTRSGRWKHEGYGPPSGVCGHCNLVYIEQPFGGIDAFQLPGGAA